MQRDELLVDGPQKAKNLLILAHGAGAPMDSAFMNFFAENLAQHGICVVRFEFPYMRARRVEGIKRPPNKKEVLLETWLDVVSLVQSEFRNTKCLHIGGKSMGGRMATMIAAQVNPAGVICLGYPFHALGKPEQPRIEHLLDFQIPALMVQGTRDTLGTQEDILKYGLSDTIQILWLEDGDHGFKPRVKSGYTQEGHWATAAKAIVDFISNLN